MGLVTSDAVFSVCRVTVRLTILQIIGTKNVHVSSTLFRHYRITNDILLLSLKHPIGKKIYEWINLVDLTMLD